MLGEGAGSPQLEPEKRKAYALAVAIEDFTKRCSTYGKTIDYSVSRARVLKEELSQLELRMDAVRSEIGSFTYRAEAVKLLVWLEGKMTDGRIRFSVEVEPTLRRSEKINLLPRFQDCCDDSHSYEGFLLPDPDPDSNAVLGSPNSVVTAQQSSKDGADDVTWQSATTPSPPLPDTVPDLPSSQLSALHLAAVDQLLLLPPLKAQTHEAIHNYLTTTYDVYRQLPTSQASLPLPDYILFRLAFNRLPKPLRDGFGMGLRPGQVPTVAQLFDFLEQQGDLLRSFNCQLDPTRSPTDLTTRN